jgi:aarF domain-containing kinase
LPFAVMECRHGVMQGVYVPDMFTDLTTQRVLVMEWIDGTRLKSSSQGGQGAREELQMVEIGVRCSLEQMLEEGYYHSDPHPGNLFKMKTGKLAYIDFGMMGEIEGSIRRFDCPTWQCCWFLSSV